MDTPETRYDLTKAGLEALTAYLRAHNNLNAVYPTILEDQELTYGASTSNLFLQWQESHSKFEAVDEGSLERKIIATLRSLAKTLGELKAQLDQAQLQNLIKMHGWEKVSDGNKDLKEKDTTIRNNIRNLKFCVQMLSPTV
ncbi:hypothetical protein TMatcc_008581 [Talaromyces marneffei ATCC 18224]|uniref:Uncharacterized protein n=2 Tax=Talaromyces marneffei TaxID=37727 RepID=B6QLL7_TALMQ|nr:uncharacterized protein EYB26_007912 [Talaromyces marneffei]EEA21994.1 hypothetical protein PMAA_057770 [Talaromyces marneffei ATCC 18224]QGA20210.1 hypothetical protein EYB26_007912 [Talaromyces marneffei]